MTAVFSNAPGQVTVVEDTGLPMQLRIALDGWTGPQGMKAIIVGFQLGSQGNQQFTNTLRKLIYAYTFGEHIGTLALSGMCFASDCNVFGGAGGVSGLENVMQYYNQDRLSASGSPVNVAIGSSVRFPAFLTSISAGVQDPSLGLSQFTLGMHCPPADT